MAPNPGSWQPLLYSLLAVTGYTFGKVIYFVDIVSKSINYCHMSQGDPGLILLGEVDRGNMYILKHACHISKLPRVKLRVQGWRKTTPGPSVSITLQGVEVPLAQGISPGVNDICLLLYRSTPPVTLLG